MAESHLVARMDVASGRTSVRGLRRFAVASFFGSLVLLGFLGAPYYVLPIAERVRHPLHIWFKPSGYVGQSAGLLALALFLFMYLYPLRKRLRVLRGVGSLPRWLGIHILAGIAVPIVGAIHAGWRFSGLIGLGYVAMLMVSLSGVVGRYLYLHIPHGRSGRELGRREVAERRAELTESIAQRSGLKTGEISSLLAGCDLEAVEGGVLSTLKAMATGDLKRWRTLRRLRRDLLSRGDLSPAAVRQVVRMTRRQIALGQQQPLLATTQRLFGYWHVIHQPFSITAFLAVSIHVVVAVSLGVTWFW